MSPARSPTLIIMTARVLVQSERLKELSCPPFFKAATVGRTTGGLVLSHALSPSPVERLFGEGGTLWPFHLFIRCLV